MKLDWTQQPGETAKAYRAFECYRELGEGRTREGVAAKCQKHVSMIYRWGRRWRWNARIKALKLYQLDQERLAMNEEARKRSDEMVARRMQVVQRELDAADRGVRIAGLLLDKAEQLLKLPVVKQTKREETIDPASGAVVAIHITEIHPVHGDPASWTGTAHRVLEASSKLQRMATGMITDKTEVQATVTTNVVKFVALKVDPKKVTG